MNKRILNSTLPVFGLQGVELDIGNLKVHYDEGEGGDDFDLAKLLENDKAKAAITAWAERELVTPVKNKRDEVLGKLVKYKIKKDDGSEEYLDPAAALDAINKIKDGITPEAKKEIEKAVEEANRRSSAEIDNLKAQLSEKDKALALERQDRHNTKIDGVLEKHLIDSGVKPGKRHLHEKYLRDFIAVAEEEGKESIVILDKTGKPRYGSKGLMSVAEFIGEYKNREGVAEDWNPTVKGGSGTAPGSSGRGNLGINQDLPAAERLKIHRRSMAAR